MGLNYIDIILSVPMAIGMVRGLFKGFIKEVLGLTGIILGIAASYYYSGDLAAYLRISLENAGKWLDIISYLVLFSVTVIGVNLLARYLTSVSQMIALGLVNRIAGGMFGLAKVILVMMLIIHLFGHWFAHLRGNFPIWQESSVYDLLEEYSIIPGNLFEKAAEEFEDKNLDFPTLETP
jgi:membrane protein required for colicin V production